MMRDPNALAAYLEEREGWAFGYADEPQTHDCARFFAAGVEAVTGVNPLSHFGGHWTSERGARRVLAKHRGMAAAVSEVMTEIAPTLAQRGDGGLTADSTLVLVEGDAVVGLDPVRGYVRQARSALIRAWTV